MNALFLTHHHHYHYLGCEHKRLGRPLLTPKVDHNALHRPMVNIRMPTQLRAVHLTLFYLEQGIFGQIVLIEYTATVSYINKQGGVVFKTLNEVCTL